MFTSMTEILFTVMTEELFAYMTEIMFTSMTEVRFIYMALKFWPIWLKYSWQLTRVFEQNKQFSQSYQSSSTWNLYSLFSNVKKLCLKGLVFGTLPLIGWQHCGHFSTQHFVCCHLPCTLFLMSMCVYLFSSADW